MGDPPCNESSGGYMKQNNCIIGWLSFIDFIFVNGLSLSLSYLSCHKFNLLRHYAFFHMLTYGLEFGGGSGTLAAISEDVSPWRSLSRDSLSWESWGW